MNDYESSMAIFFRLDMPIPALTDSLENVGDFVTELKPYTQRLSQDVQIGPPVLLLGSVDEIKFEYIGERYLLRFKCSIGQMKRLFEEVCEAFSEDFAFSNTVRYFEFNFPGQPIPIDGGVNQIIRTLDVPSAKKVSQYFDIDELGPYSFSLSSPQSPLNDRWINLDFTPLPTNPEGAIFLRITKRAKTDEEMKTFLQKMTDPEEIVKIALEM
ncbi:MAG: hypothetical protein ACE5OZ_17575 [Candidatus Heimdallarchaeota archaeon]